MGSPAPVKQQVRDFYDEIGWRSAGPDAYQNTRYEDLRPETREYIQRSHRRVGRHLPAGGRMLLDAGSGPVQYLEYLEYSAGFQYRLCLDLSERALQEARRRLGTHGLLVVGDIAHLPLAAGSMDALVSLHAVHHLPPDEHRTAFEEFYRALRPGGRAVVVYSWGDDSILMRALARPVGWFRSLVLAYRRRRQVGRPFVGGRAATRSDGKLRGEPFQTYTFTHGYAWARANLGWISGLQIRTWRSVNPRFLRTFIHRRLFGATWLRVLYWLEERAPGFFGRVGQYPMFVFTKTGGRMPEAEGTR